MTFIAFISCHSKTNMKQKICNKWYQGKEFYLEFKEDGHFQQEFYVNEDTILKHNGTYSSKNDSLLKVHYLDIDADHEFGYMVKDSILLLVYHLDVKKEDAPVESGDSTYYHLNPYYTTYEMEQIFKYGKIIDTNRRTPLPFIYFEF